MFILDKITGAHKEYDDDDDIAVLLYYCLAERHRQYIRKSSQSCFLLDNGSALFGFLPLLDDWVFCEDWGS